MSDRLRDATCHCSELDLRAGNEKAHDELRQRDRDISLFPELRLRNPVVEA